MGVFIMPCPRARGVSYCVSFTFAPSGHTYHSSSVTPRCQCLILLTEVTTEVPVAAAHHILSANWVFELCQGWWSFGINSHWLSRGCPPPPCLSGAPKKGLTMEHMRCCQFYRLWLPLTKFGSAGCGAATNGCFHCDHFLLRIVWYEMSEMTNAKLLACWNECCTVSKSPKGNFPQGLILPSFYH